MSPRTRGVVACVAASAALVAFGCSSDAPTVDAPHLSETDAAACRRLVDALPDTLAGHERVDASGDTAYGAAWGDPAIVLTCGVGRPARFDDTSSCVTMDRTGWYVPDEVLLSADNSRDVTTTEMNYRPRVHLVVPGEYRPDGFTNSIGAIGKLVEQTLWRTGRCR